MNARQSDKSERKADSNNNSSNDDKHGLIEEMKKT